MNHVSRKAVRCAAVSAIAGNLTILALAVSTPAAADNAWPRNVSASYTVRVAGVKFGSFNFSSARSGKQYQVNSSAKLRAFFGAFKWRGSAGSTGTIVKSAPWPATYKYSARRKKKRAKNITMALKNRNVTSLHLDPPPNPSKQRVPLHPEDKKNILDPMSAIIALTAPAKGGNPCRQSVAIFDGKHRFDVHLTKKGTKTVEIRGQGFSSKARICRVRYVPVSGHKTGKKNNYIVDTKGMEVWMVPAADASMYMPYRIVVPTIIGNATLQAASVSVEMSNNRKLALVN